MAHPKRRHSRGRQGKRRAQDGLTKVNLVADPETGEMKLRHRVSESGKYRGRQVIVRKAKEEKTS